MAVDDKCITTGDGTKRFVWFTNGGKEYNSIPVVCSDTYGYQPFCTNGVIYRVYGLGNNCSMVLPTGSHMQTSDLGSAAVLSSGTWSVLGYPFFGPTMASGQYEKISLGSDQIGSKLTLTAGTAKSTTPGYFKMTKSNVSTLYNAGWRYIYVYTDAVIYISTSQAGIFPQLICKNGTSKNRVKSTVMVSLSNTSFPDTTYTVALDSNHYYVPQVKATRSNKITLNSYTSNDLYIGVPAVAVKGSQSATTTVRIMSMNIAFSLTKEAI